MDYRLGKTDLASLVRRMGRSDTYKLSWPTRITLLRILLIAPFIGCMVNTHDPELSAATHNLLRHIAIAVFVVMALSDALDGYLARHRGQITMLGTFLDPLADKLLITSASLLLVSASGYVPGFRLPATVVVLIIGKDIVIVMGFLIIYLITSKVHIVPVWAGKLATAVQLVMVAGVLIGPELAAVIPGYHVFTRVLWWSAAGTAVLAALIYIRNGSRYIEQYERAQSKSSSGG
jgi:cardiolipin synthase